MESITRDRRTTNDGILVCFSTFFDHTPCNRAFGSLCMLEKDSNLVLPSLEEVCLFYA